MMMMIARSYRQFGVRAKQCRPAWGPVFVVGLLVGLLSSSTVVRGQLAADVLEKDVESELTAQLSAQAAAWNEGDLDRFMQFYWKSERLSFSSGGRTVRGWQATRDGYVRRYPDQTAMGRLVFERLEIVPLSETVALVLGHWQLDRAAGRLRGNFSLVFRQIEGQWLIIHDHTSLLPPEAAASDD